MSMPPQPASTAPPPAQPVSPSNRVAPDSLVRILRARLGKNLTNGQLIHGCSVRMLKKRLSSKQVMAYKLALFDPATNNKSYLELIGKRETGRAGAKAAQEFRAMRMLWERGFGTDRQFRIPRPIEHFPDLNLILEERAPGLALSSFVGRNDETSRAHFMAAGVWLARLHNLKTLPGVCSYEPELAALKVFVDELSASLPSLSPELQRLDAVIRQKFASFQGTATTMVHGDFHPENILVAGGSTTVVDFDRFCFSDPARDLGSFVAHVRTRACVSGKSLAAANQEVDAFRNGYFSAIPLARGACLARRIAPFVAHACLEALYYVACVMKVPDPGLHAIYLRSGLDSGVLAVAAPRASDTQRAYAAGVGGV